MKSTTLQNPREAYRLIVAVLIPLTAFGVQWVFWAAIQPYVWFLFFPAVFFGSWVGGRQGGLVATALSTGLAWYFFIPPQFSFAVQSPMAYVSIVMFVGMGVLFSLTHERLQKANVALRMSEEKLSVALHSIGDAVLATDTQGRITRLNLVAEKLTGWTQAEALGRPVEEVFRIVNEETHEPAVIPVSKVLATGKIHGLANHTIVIARDGTERPISDSAAPICGKDGQIFGVVLVFRDVSEERAAQRALRESEARYRTLFNSIDEGFCIIEMMFDEQEKPVDYRFLEINPSFEKQTGLRDAVGKRMRELAPQHEAHWFETYGRIAVTGEAARFQNRAEQLHRSYDVYAFRFGEPKSRQVAILFSDITERKQMEEALRVSEENLDITLHSIGDAVLATDTEGRVTRLNPIAEKLTGWTQAEALGRPIAEVFHIINEQTRQPAIIPVDEVLATGEIHGLANHTIVIARDGTERPIADSAAPIRDKDGQVLGVVLVFRDVSEEHRALAEIARNARVLADFKAALDEHAIVAITDTSGKITYANDKFCAISKYSREELLGQDHRILNSGHHPKEYFREMWETIASGRVCKGEIKNRAKDGSFYWMTSTIVPFLGADGKPSQYIAIRTDITSQKRAEEEIHNFNVGLEELVAQRTAETREALATLDATEDGAFIFDPETLRFSYVNQGAVRQMGYAREELLGMTPLDIKPEFPEAKFRAMIAPMLRGEVRTHRFTTLHRHKDGHDIPVEINLQYIAPAGERPRFIAIVRDITDRKRTEEQLRVQASALDAAANAIVITDHTGTIQSVNPAFTTLTGYTAQEAVGQNPRILKSGKHDEAAYRNLWQTISAGQVWNGEVINRRKDGSLYTEEMTITPVRNGDGVIASYIAIKQDITGRKRAEEKFRLFRTLVDQSSDAFEIIDPETGRYLDVNERGCSDVGYSREELLALRVFDIDPMVEQSEFLKVVEELRKSGVLLWQGVHRRKDGSTFPVEVNLKYVRLDRDYIVTVVRDITERKRAENFLANERALLRSLVDHLPLAVYLKDLEGRKTLANPVELNYTGATSEAEVLGKTDFDLFPPEVAAACRVDDQEVLDTGQPVLNREGSFTKPDGSIIWLLTSKVPLLDAAGHVTGLAVINLDITERQKSERLALRTQRLESIGTLAGGVAHDLNNALAPILMSTELLRMQYPGETKMIDTVEACAKRGADMVRQLLSFAKGAEGERVLLQPGRLVKELENMMKGSFPKNIQLVVKCDPKLPTVLGDATQLHQVLLNLCVNARDAMPHGGTLTLEAQRREVDAAYAGSVFGARPGKYLALCVRDTGTGIPPEIIDRIFDPFFTTKGPEKGTGLGLSTVMGIVKGHGGFMHVDSQPGQGSTFTAYLPADRPGGGDTEHVIKPVEEFCGQGETILFVDDEVAVREAGCAVLRRLNFKPLTATDGADGLILTAQHRTELRAIITDLHMPHMDGLAFVRALRRMLPDIPIMMASGRMEDALAGEFKTLGVTSRLDKPFTEAQLAEALKNLFAQK
ncbi:MAG: PAS domain S-box protein [Verrucomicrobiales bacterium]|nr:PAS domain S-box protein [Verrucomicrobiales bacterium]